jgi:hypothetical protein
MSELPKYKVLISGVPRTGSTVLWQNIENIRKLELALNRCIISLFREHGGTRGRWKKYDYIFFPVRNIFDVIVSVMKSHEYTFEQVLEFESFWNHIREFNADYTLGIIIPYEKYLPDNVESLIRDVYKIITKTDLSDYDVNLMAEATSFEVNKTISDKHQAETFHHKINRPSMIHKNHITSDGYGFGSTLTDEQKDILLNMEEVKKYNEIINSYDKISIGDN